MTPQTIAYAEYEECAESKINKEHSYDQNRPIRYPDPGYCRYKTNIECNRTLTDHDWKAKWNQGMSPEGTLSHGDSGGNGMLGNIFTESSLCENYNKKRKHVQHLPGAHNDTHLDSSIDQYFPCLPVPQTSTLHIARESHLNIPVLQSTRKSMCFDVSSHTKDKVENNRAKFSEPRSSSTLGSAVVPPEPQVEATSSSQFWQPWKNELCNVPPPRHHLNTDQPYGKVYQQTIQTPYFQNNTNGPHWFPLLSTERNESLPGLINGHWISPLNGHTIPTLPLSSRCHNSTTISPLYLTYQKQISQMPLMCHMTNTSMPSNTQISTGKLSAIGSEKTAITRYKGVIHSHSKSTNKPRVSGASKRKHSSKHQRTSSTDNTKQTDNRSATFGESHGKDPYGISGKCKQTSTSCKSENCKVKSSFKAIRGSYANMVPKLTKIIEPRNKIKPKYIISRNNNASEITPESANDILEDVIEALVKRPIDQSNVYKLQLIAEESKILPRVAENTPPMKTSMLPLRVDTSSVRSNTSLVRKDKSLVTTLTCLSVSDKTKRLTETMNLTLKSHHKLQIKDAIIPRKCKVEQRRSGLVLIPSNLT